MQRALLQVEERRKRMFEDNTYRNPRQLHLNLLAPEDLDEIDPANPERDRGEPETLAVDLIEGRSRGPLC
jgi:hypothetical protein